MPCRQAKKVQNKRSRDKISGSQTSIFTTDLGTPAAMALHTSSVPAGTATLVAPNKNSIIEDIGKEEIGAAGRQSADDLQSLRGQIRSITRDMDALDHSCSADLLASDHPREGSQERAHLTPRHRCRATSCVAHGSFKKSEASRASQAPATPHATKSHVQ